MAHEIYIDNGRASMFYVEEVPWHGLGTKLNRPATAEEAIQAANLDWDVVKQPLYAIGGSVVLPVPERFGMVREDLWGKPECKVLGIVSEDYTPLQNREAFAFFDQIVGEGAAIYHTAGALGNGERVWILAKLPSSIRVIGDDITDKYLLLSNSHDGNSPVQIKFTPIRVVCNNTLTIALRKGRTIRVTHSKDLQKRLKQAEWALGLIHQQYEEIEKTFTLMARVEMNKAKSSEYFSLVFPNPANPEDRDGLNRAERDRKWAKYFYENGEGNTMKKVTGTLWAAYNGVTEYIDHCRSPKSRQTNDRRLNFLWFGDGYQTKARAFRLAAEKVQEWLH